MHKRLANHRSDARRGFTLVELVIVMVIFGVVVAIAAPRFASANARQQLEAAADRVIADLERASTRAHASSVIAKVSFNTESSSYQLNNAGGDSLRVRLGESPYDVSIKSAAFGDGTTAQFNVFGRPIDPGTVVLSNAADSITITLHASGEVTR